MKSRSRVSSPAGFIIFPARNKQIVRESAGNRDALLCHSCRWRPAISTPPITARLRRSPGNRATKKEGVAFYNVQSIDRQTCDRIYEMKDGRSSPVTRAVKASQCWRTPDLSSRPLSAPLPRLFSSRKAGREQPDRSDPARKHAKQ